MSVNLDMDALRAFVTGVELSSFARASARVGRSQSAISMQLKKLEHQTGQVLLERRGRGLVPTEAGELLLNYARRILAMNDEATTSLGTAAAPAVLRIGLPQDFFEDVMPAVIEKFARRHPGMHLEVVAGRNFILEEEVRSGRIDSAIAFFRHDPRSPERSIAALPVHWLASPLLDDADVEHALPMVLYDHPCLFRQGAIQALDQSARRWRFALTTPSLPGVWAAVKSRHGITVRINHRVPEEIEDVKERFDLPDLPKIDVRLLRSDTLSPAGSYLHSALEQVLKNELHLQ